MDGFYGRVLPAVGPFSLLTGTTGPDGKLDEQRHWNGLKTHSDVEREVQRLSALPLNVFFAVGSYAGKNRRDPIAKRCLYLDLDSKDFGSVEVALQQLGAFVRAVGLPAPSIYVHSGRGVHIYWCLDRDVPVDEWEPVAKALKAKCIELEFNADRSATADPARVLRCPGTLNRKDATPLPCRVLADNGTTYDIKQIAAQLDVIKTAAASKLASLVSNEDLVTRRRSEKSAAQVESMLEFIKLPEMGGRDEWITVLCAINDWSNKSEEGFGLFHTWSSGQPGYVSEQDCRRTWESFKPGGGIGIGTLVKLARDAGYTEQGDFPSGAAVAEPSLAEQAADPSPAPGLTGAAAFGAVGQGPNITTKIIASPLMIAADNAVRATGNVRFEPVAAMHWLANEFVMITDQDGIFYSMTNRIAMTRVVIDDLLTRYMPLNASGIPINASAILRRYGTVNSVNSMGFYPGAGSVYTENGRSYVNQYSNPPDMVPGTASEVALIEDFWDYVFPREDDQPFSDYLLQFYGHVVQHPSIKIASAPLMISKEYGTGKTTIMYDIPKALAGPHSSRLVSNKVLRSAFSDYLAGAHFLHFDEVHINGRFDSDDTANSMKNLITGVNVEVHPKGLRPFNIPNRIFITATSNYDDAISLPSNDERRWGIYYLRPLRQWTSDQKAAYFTVLHKWIASPRGAGVLRWYFNQIDLTGFNPQSAPPSTSDKELMVVKSQREEVRILISTAQEGAAPFDRELFTAEEVRMFLQNENGKTYSTMAAVEFIRRAFPNAVALKQIRDGAGRARPWTVINHAKWEAATIDELRKGLQR